MIESIFERRGRDSQIAHKEAPLVHWHSGAALASQLESCQSLALKLIVVSPCNSTLVRPPEDRNGEKGGPSWREISHRPTSPAVLTDNLSHDFSPMTQVNAAMAARHSSTCFPRCRRLVHAPQHCAGLANRHARLVLSSNLFPIAHILVHEVIIVPVGLLPHLTLLERPLLAPLDASSNHSSMYTFALVSDSDVQVRRFHDQRVFQ